MFSYKSLLPQSCRQYSEQLQVLIASLTKRQREELDRNVQLQVLIASVLQSSDTERRTRYELQLQVLIASALQSVLKERVELDRNVQLQVLIAFSPCSQFSEHGEKN